MTARTHGALVVLLNREQIDEQLQTFEDAVA